MKQSRQFSRAEAALGEWSREAAEAEVQNVPPDRLAAAITDFIEWRAFAYWVRLAHEHRVVPAVQIESILAERCPGFLATEIAYRDAHPREPEFRWLRLIQWIDGNIFHYADAAGWRHALGYYAARDERLDRVRARWLKCDEQWNTRIPEQFPDFEKWRQSAFVYTNQPVQPF